MDAIYMTAVQAPHRRRRLADERVAHAEKEPFFGGTYFPPRDGDARRDRGLPRRSSGDRRALGEDPERVSAGDRARSSTAVRDRARRRAARAGDGLPGREGRSRTRSRVFRRSFDDAPRRRPPRAEVPLSLPVRLLLAAPPARTGRASRSRWRRSRSRGWPRAGSTTTSAAASTATRPTPSGSCRTSRRCSTTTRSSRSPYAEAWQVTGRRDLARVARQTLDYLVREMTSPEGALYSATDADSEGEEGRFFVWDASELRALLGDDAERFCAFHGVTRRGELRGAEHPHRPAPGRGRVGGARAARAQLYEARDEAGAPLRDEKVLAGWNGLGISALAFGGRVLGDRALRRRRRARGRVRARADGEGRPAAAELARRRSGRARPSSRTTRSSRRGSSTSTRRRSSALARGGGRALRARSSGCSAIPAAAAGSRRRPTTSGCSRARSRPTTAPSRPERPSRS